MPEAGYIGFHRGSLAGSWLCFRKRRGSLVTGPCRPCHWQALRQRRQHRLRLHWARGRTIAADAADDTDAADGHVPPICIS